MRRAYGRDACLSSAAPIGSTPDAVLGLIRFEAEAAETLVKAGNLTILRNTLRAAGPCWVRFWINVQCHRVAFLAPRGAGLEFGPIGHFNRNHVVIGVDIFFHEGVL